MNLTVLQGDWVEQLRTLPDASVHCCVTSPPYWGLRDYGVEGQLGMEKTPGEYVSKMVEGFSEVRRVLRDDGTVWLNLGDSYASGGGRCGKGKHSADPKHAAGMDDEWKGYRPVSQGWTQPNRMPLPGLKTKDLIGLPWHVAFALQADGWYLRSDIIWHKPNPMPESVTDRPTKSHEYIFLFSKQQRYFYDNEAIREPHANPEFINGEKYGTLSEHNKFSSKEGNRSIQFGTEWSPKERAYNPNGRNKRTVWTVATAPYSEAHFATFPPDLIKPCILAGSPVNGTVLDPFAGSGTTGLVALELGRHSLLIELSPAYCNLIRSRTNVTPGLPL